MREKPLFDDEAEQWESLYRESPGERWGLLQGYARKRTQARLELCLSLLPDVRGKEVIELGCGPGYYAVRLMEEGARWTGLDISEKMLAACRENARSGRLIRADVTVLPFRPGCCDVIICIGVLSYLKRSGIASLLAQVYAALRPGGMLLAQTVRFDPLTWIRCRLPSSVPRPIRIPGPFYPRNPRSIRRLLERADLTLRRIVPYRKFLVYPAGTIYLAEKIE
jgi:SAM-dependent methyltransferase